jgi:hypothetical protein
MTKHCASCRAYRSEAGGKNIIGKKSLTWRCKDCLDRAKAANSARKLHEKT